MAGNGCGTSVNPFGGKRGDQLYLAQLHSLETSESGDHWTGVNMLPTWLLLDTQHIRRWAGECSTACPADQPDQQCPAEGRHLTSFFTQHILERVSGGKAGGATTSAPPVADFAAIQCSRQVVAHCCFVGQVPARAMRHHQG